MKKHIYTQDVTVKDCENSCPFHRYSSWCKDGDQWYCVLNKRFVIENPVGNEELCGMKEKRIRTTYEEMLSADFHKEE